MLLYFFLANPHIGAFLLITVLGLVSLALAPIMYIRRTGRLRTIYAFWEIANYNSIERRLICIGAVLAIMGIAATAYVSDRYGYYRLVNDVHGKRSLEWSKSISSTSLGDKRHTLLSRSSGKTVLPGTWQWDIDTDSIGGDRREVDLWWAHRKGKRSLEVMNGAAMAMLDGVSYEALDDKYIKKCTLSTHPIDDPDSSQALNPGTVIAVRTSAGNLAKLRISRFLELHDFSFSGSEVLDDSWRTTALGLPNIKKYHMEIEWTLYSEK